MEKDKQKKGFDLKRTAKTVGKTAAGAGLAVSMFFGSLFSSPAEIVKPEEVSPPPAIVQQAVMYEEEPPFMLDTEEPEEEKKGLRDRIRAWLIRLPLAVRILVLVPMWAIGFGLITAFSLLAGLINVPVIGTVLKFIIGALIVFALIMLAMKLIFPDIPLKKLFSKRNLLVFGVSACVIGLAGALGGLLWEDKPYITAAIDTAAAAAYAAFFLIFIRRPDKEKAGESAA